MDFEDDTIEIQMADGKTRKMRKKDAFEFIHDSMKGIKFEGEFGFI